MGPPVRFIWWLLFRLLFALLLAGLALAGLGLRSFLRDPGDFDARRQETMQALTAETGRLQAALAGTTDRMAAIGVAIAAQKERAAQAGRVARELEELSGGWNRLTTASAQLQENRERMARMQQMEARAIARTADFEQTLLKTQWEKDGLEIALARKQAELDAARADTSKLWHYARLTWETHGRWVPLAAVLVVFAPILLRRSRRE